MRVFLLEPIEEHLSDSSWQASSIQEICLIKANSEEHARVQAAQITTRFYERQPDGRTLFSPWLDPKITRCGEANPPIEVPEAYLITDSGLKLS